MTEQEQRAAVVAEALTWIGTDYHPAALVKMRKEADGRIVDRGGVDCAHLPYGVYRAAGVVGQVDIPYYPPDWHLHRSAERYAQIVLGLAREFQGPPGLGDLVLYKMGRAFAHGAIVVGWPEIVHASFPARRVIRDLYDAGDLKGRPMRFFTFW